jgi:hypothetical protein
VRVDPVEPRLDPGGTIASSTQPAAARPRRATRLAARLALVAAAAVAVAGCGGHDSTSSAPAAPAASDSTARASTGTARETARPTVVVGNVPFPTNLTFDGRGGLWVSSGAGGSNPTDGIWYVPPGGRPRHVAKGLTAAFGLTWVGDRLYVAHITSASEGTVTILEGFDGKAFARRRPAVTGIPVGNNTLGSIIKGPGGRLFVGAGATGHKSGPTGRVLSFPPDGHRAVVEATGLNSAFGLAVDGDRVLVTDNGRDDLGPFRPADELNAFDPAGRIVDFGYIRCYGQGGSACAGTQAPLVRLAPHAAPVGIAVRGDVAYVAENGSLFERNPTGSDIQRVDLRTGRRSLFWHSPVKHDPTGLAIGPDGKLYLTLYASGKVVRFDI